jgi:hypothetical protein
MTHMDNIYLKALWIIIPAVPEWRWEVERTDTPWYGSARLFRQGRVGDRCDVFAEIALALEQLVRERGRRSA